MSPHTPDTLYALTNSLRGAPCCLPATQAPAIAQALLEGLEDLSMQVWGQRTALQGSTEPLARFEDDLCRWLDPRLSATLDQHLTRAGLSLVSPIPFAQTLLIHIKTHPLHTQKGTLVHLQPQVLALQFDPLPA